MITDVPLTGDTLTHNSVVRCSFMRMTRMRARETPLQIQSVTWGRG